MKDHGPKSGMRSVDLGPGLTTHMSSIGSHKSRLPSSAFIKLITWDVSP